ncbi:MAG: PD-(D/E)XK nuclease family protein [Firmicutes bacterium]|nr:PD-(D/E)XK nuclease family protein [Bacillota bacterium]MCM1401097.1 PD-(D/E)XK nuclease family protein [Bacteroides sp.]MCM1477080.1 PD-(D/E)XK nuclease family protein [Bacteroides sp.]
MTPFLQQVARVYARNETENLLDYCFVFPNKRSATFFSWYLDKELKGTVMMPAAITISDFVASLSPLVEANRYEQLFTLFCEYRKLPGVDIDFDRFLFWGEMLINDFNDVDRYLVDPKALFVNVKRLREISSNYLTPEQLRVIERFWGEQAPHQHVEHFWRHLDYGDTTLNREKFLKLWEVLLPLYKSFNSSLAERGLTSNGMLYRNAANVLKIGTDTVVKRYVFVGFNVLSTSEIEIFSCLQKRGMADFYWDFNSPAFRLKDNRARRFIVKNIEEFPSLYALDEPQSEHMPVINIIGVPSATGQVKAAGEQIRQWVADKNIADCNNAMETAVVLPDESLFIPMIHSIPSEITNLNVTMGFPMRLSPVATFVNQIISLQMRMRMVHGEPAFFHEDIRPLLTSAIIESCDPDGSARLSAYISKNHLFQIPISKIHELLPGAEAIFKPLGTKANVDEVDAYVERLCEFLLNHIGETDKIGRKFVEAYSNAMRNLCAAARDYGIELHGHALFQMVERAVNSDSVNFVGEPLKGLQVMGVLETRALDFKNVIMLSMNERVFPRKLYTRSFIPDALRRGYGMATLDFQESIFAYYFYRLLSRAEKVTLVYDARRVGGSRSNEISRYVAQLLYVFGGKNVKHSLGVYSSMPFETIPIVIPKSERILGLLKKFTPGGGRKNLSATAINSYINCPLEFYLRFVEGYNGEDEITDYVDFSTFGSILHDVMERFYKQYQNNDDNGKLMPVVITESLLKETIESPSSVKLDRLITESINRLYNNYPPDKLLTPLAGETLVLGRVFKETIIEMLKVDMANTPFTFVAAEFEMAGTLKINNELSVNVRQIIDRIDVVDNRMRFVDYKTGDDTIDSSSVSELFNGSNPKRAKALMQLFLYCHIYRNLMDDARAIEPIVYKMRTLIRDGVKQSVIGSRSERKTVTDYNDFYEEFCGELNAKIEEMFNPDVPFTQAETEHSCKFCQFKSLCGREE